MKIAVLAALGVLALPACAEVPVGGPATEPASRRVAYPATRDVDLYTHCGVESAFVEGRWWHVVDPLYGPDGPGTGPPDGWGDPYQPGRVSVAGDLAVFESRGQRVLLVPAPTDDPVRVCR